MELYNLLVGALLLALPLIGAGLLGTIIMLERPQALAPVAANGAPDGGASRRRRKGARRRR